MSKYKKAQQSSSETINTAEAIAKSIKKTNQTKEQTKIITQGIQKGITEYKKQQKVKVRELNKLKKKITQQKQENTIPEKVTHDVIKCKVQWLPWLLLIFSWMVMAIFISGYK